MLDTTIDRCTIRDVVEGIDVSEYQGPIDWEAVRASGRHFVFVRASIGTTLDKSFEAHAMSAKEAGLLVGGYHFARYECHPVESAHRFAVRLERHQALDLPPALDLESDVVTTADLRAWIESFVSTVIAVTGIKPMIYTGPGYATAWLAGYESLVDMPLWGSHYGVAYPDPVHPWNTRPLIWQYAGNTIYAKSGALLAKGGRCPGVTGECDLNAYLGDYEGLSGLVETCRVTKWTSDPTPWWGCRTADQIMASQDWII